ncbi:MAG: hypothetical protein RL685_4103 [Pseudomonadota bacterium]|jgi:hypothetical protein
MTPVIDPTRAPHPDDAVSFEAPYLLRRLVDSGVVEDEQAAALVFTELKRYLVLTREQVETLPMFSAIVDAAWHQFVLFTHEYQEYCERYLGRFLHHVPAGAPAESQSAPGMTWAQFVALYERRFGPLPWIWDDARFVRDCIRVKHTRYFRHGTYLQREATRVHLVMAAEPGQRLCSTELRAQPALEFIAQHREFLVRELPQLRSTAERLLLIQPLVHCHILQLVL